MPAYKQPVSVLVVIYTAPGETAIETTSHLTRLPNNDSQVIGYSHSNRPSSDKGQVAGYSAGTGQAASPFATSGGSGQAQDVKVLLLERADHPGYWQSVTGSLEPGETLAEAAKREVREETGLDTTQYLLTDWQSQNVYEIYPHWRFRYPPDITHNTEHVFGLELPRVAPVQLAPREHLRYQWLAWQDAAEAVFSPSNRAAILRIPDHVFPCLEKGK